MGREDEVIIERLKKMQEMKKVGIEPYSYRFDKKNNAADLQKEYEKLENEKYGKEASVAGRVMSVRDIGKIAFVVLQDSSGKIQIVIQEGQTDKKEIDLFKSFIDSGDIIGVKGDVFRTRRGELSVLAKKIEILTKALKPIPESFYGLKDEEERYRKRYLDMTLNQNVKKIFESRAKMLKVMRNFMEKNNFIEVETPLLQNVYGGANAKPFRTHCDAFNSDVYLSIAPELYLKKALVGGFERVYEITKKFRNEGVDRQHNPEHMTIEWYQSYADYNDGMKLFEELLKEIAIELYGKTTIEYNGHQIDLTKWRKIPLLEAIKEYLGEDISKVKTDADAKKIASKHGLDEKEITKVNLADELMKTFREKLIQPTFLIDYPIELAPLSKPKRGDPTKAEIFQPFIGGMEVARAYSELSDPRLQEEHFREQEEDREKGNKEAMPTDKDFVNALEYAMPPACGVGIGIERLLMLFTNTNSIREVIMFPFMKSVDANYNIPLKDAPEVIKEQKVEVKEKPKTKKEVKKKK